MDGAIELLAGLRPSEDTEPVKVLEETIEYLDNQRVWLCDYQALKDQGCTIRADGSRLMRMGGGGLFFLKSSAPI